MKVHYNNQYYDIEASALVGYESDKVRVRIENEECCIGGSMRTTQIIFCLPEMDEMSYHEISQLEHTLSSHAWEQTQGYIVTSSSLTVSLNHFHVAYDYYHEFEEYYGMGLPNHQLAKGVFVISKEGTLCYRDIPKDALTAFHSNKLLQEIIKTYKYYTGVGCEDI